MAPMKSLTAVAVLALAVCSQVVSAQQQQHVFSDVQTTIADNSPLGDLGNWFEDALEDIQEAVEDVRKTVTGVLEDAYDNSQKEWLKVFSHPAFPEYSMRYKKPALCDPDVKQISGYIDIDTDKHFFFWFFESRDKPASDPLILWLNGGPGCSSLTGLMMELGPCSVNDEGTDTIINKYSWNNNANIVFLDQPLNVGYSYGSDGASNTNAAAKDVYAFLQLFFQEFPEYADLDFHVAGESYAGHYIPAIGEQIHNNNKGKFAVSSLAAHQNTLADINLKSLMIGNGLTDPLIQYKWYAKMACENNYGPVLDNSTCKQMEANYPACARLIQNCYDNGGVFSCLPAAMKCNKDQLQPYQQTGMNPYDVRKKCEGGNLCYTILESVKKYLNIPEVKKELGAQVDTYESCNMQINFRFQMAGDWMKPFHLALPPLLEDGIRVLIYAGDADFICNWMGNKAWTLELPWSGQKEFAAAKDKTWYSDLGDEEAGEVRSVQNGNFTFLRIYGGGHMVPYDQPENSLDFVNKWIGGKALA
ncbi:hypothetical protein K450DRAFT_253641 [Umbelopsis ramanniana AG]|uniref:Carboxypeptidase n=1 Tax=Umbelopsis ramanniana AG TaxID=1314678 RepID=A0AAD5E5L7_UMBRA|nr:uncharacterized protein K450DRAFT_253641 [Umbelopsis ramanniana AG]KAI8577099.1 hypothetical protein K450DRAFT_253641 [Umbelopsis ramanniana AG]